MPYPRWGRPKRLPAGIARKARGREEGPPPAQRVSLVLDRDGAAALAGAVVLAGAAIVARLAAALGLARVLAGARVMRRGGATALALALVLALAAVRRRGAAALS